MSYLQKYWYEPKQNMSTVKPKVKYEFFLRYYKENFNYPFGRPRVDVCATCEKLKVDIQCEKVTTVREKLKTELKLHKTKAQNFYTLMKESEIMVKEGGNEHGVSEAIALDYMQNIPYPYIPITEMFYARQLWLYNFGIHRFSDGESFMYPYTELVGKKGPSEVISFLHHFIDNIDLNVRKLYTFSDACRAQNRNNTIVKYLSYLTDHGRFDYIRHVYMACDRDFAEIALSKRKQDVVYTAEDWIDIMQNSSKKINVVKVEQSMIKGFF